MTDQPVVYSIIYQERRALTIMRLTFCFVEIVLAISRGATVYLDQMIASGPAAPIVAPECPALCPDA
jgi:hypothetical protein